MRMSMSPQKSGLHRCTGGKPFCSPLGICASRSPALLESVMRVSLAAQANQAAGIIAQRRTEQVFWLGIIERQEAAAATNSRAIDQVSGAGLDQHQLNDATVGAEPIQRLLIRPLIAGTDAVIGVGEAAVEIGRA